MNGYIEDNYRAKIKLIISNKDKEKNLEFLIDTGFDGEILLPINIVEEMEIEPIDIKLVELADGTEKTVLVSIAEIEWYKEKKEYNRREKLDHF